jgi:hypothetical protein
MMTVSLIVCLDSSRRLLPRSIGRHLWLHSASGTQRRNQDRSSFDLRRLSGSVLEGEGFPTSSKRIHPAFFSYQAIRNVADLECMAVPKKYQQIGTFHKYYSGSKEVPYPTVFIGGNHEASNYLWELYVFSFFL